MQGSDVVFLVDDEHRERTYDVETGHNENESEEDISNILLDLHDLKRVFLLLKAVFYLVFLAHNSLHFTLHCIEIAAIFESDFKRRESPLLPKKVAGKGYRGDDIVLVVFALVHREHHAGRQ